MLTEPAFNALLKILEEPPGHIIFLFATTEPYRIPTTVISRTQRFDFRRIPPSTITESLVKLTRHEKIKAESRALSYIASCSEGSLRDAQGILDQVIAYSGGEVKLEDVFRVLGMVRWEELVSVARAIAQGNLEEEFSLIQDFIDRGIDLYQFVFDLTRLFKDLLIITSVGEGAKTLIDFGTEIEDLRELARDFKTTALVPIIDELTILNEVLRRSPHPRLQLELALIKLTTKRESQLEEIYKEITSLESRLKGGIDEIHSASPSEFHHLRITPQLNIKEIRLAWPKLIKELKQERPAVASCLEAGELMEVQGSRILLGFRQDSAFQRDACEGKDAQGVIKRKIKEILGQNLEIKTTLIEESELREPRVIYQGRREDFDILKVEPMVKRAVEIFGGKIVEVKGQEHRIQMTENRCQMTEDRQ